ncbi:hypothetical protein DYB28_002840 [Aphanomyces astaci]|uniref:Cysteine/serine-rich nuclear protein N-terminal domain-containing protein n=2 Tax=Aphanomyces astaci TaxID=112090 RepID=A0A397EV22_APHAT|nr:hypothetical protein DYB31_014268 [Aphanomyces astaci]RLO07418.1 hypothetical protein DYB28_002840 [Aphanomyces astaci]
MTTATFPPLRWHVPVPMFLPWKTAEFLPPLATSATKHSKRITFTTATTYFFDVDCGGSAVPSDDGPPLGLAKTHTTLECHDIYSQVPMTKPRRVRRYDHVERMLLLQHAGYSRKQVAMCCFEGIAIRKSRLASNEDAEIEPIKKRRLGYEDTVALPGVPKRRK